MSAHVILSLPGMPNAPHWPCRQRERGAMTELPEECGAVVHRGQGLVHSGY